MNWTDEPATESQLRHLSQFGYEPDHPLTKGEAAHLIRDYEEHPEWQGATKEVGLLEITKHEAYHLRVEVEQVRQGVGGVGARGLPNSTQALKQAMARRQEFWRDTCREPSAMQCRSAQVFDLYMKHGCRFLTPTNEQVQEVLDALDGAMPAWDRDYPHLFHQTLELNFPTLLAHL